jgi:hypothetical protein
MHSTNINASVNSSGHEKAAPDRPTAFVNPEIRRAGDTFRDDPERH